MKIYQEAADYIKGKMGEISPKIAIILGSGLGVLSEEITEKIVIPYKEIPNFPVSTVTGHAGELIIGKLQNVAIIAMNGRSHYYEGYSLQEATFPIRVFKLLGINELILTNAAGGINTEYKPGDFMIINDHLSFFAESVLRGKNMDEFGPRFPDMSEVYKKDKIAKLEEIIKNKIKNKLLEPIGDIVISIEQVEKQAKEYGHSFERELAYMIVHGFYHIIGYDHIEEEQKKEMRPKEEKVLEAIKQTR